jgi:hypothetical protein
MHRRVIGLVGAACVVGLVSLAVEARQEKKDAKEVKGEIVKVDAGKNTLTVTTEAGKKLDVVVNDDVKFVGPKGGVSKEGIKDDRVRAGAPVVLVYDATGKTLKEIHLPLRADIEEKDKKEVKDKDKKEVKDKKDKDK